MSKNLTPAPRPPGVVPTSTGITTDGTVLHFGKSTKSDNGANGCVEVDAWSDPANAYVQDTTLPDGPRQANRLTFPRDEWTAFMRQLPTLTP